MRRLSQTVFALAALGAFCAAADLDPRKLSGGAATVEASGAGAYTRRAPLLDNKNLRAFAKGRAAFEQIWVKPLELGGQWGKGPVSNGSACSDCHPNNGRGVAPDGVDGVMVSMLVRLSVPGAASNGAPLPHPAYGDQLQTQGLDTEVPAEGDVRISYTPVEVRYTDGERVQLRRPNIEFRSLNFGPLGDDIMTSARVGQSLVGLGLLEAVDEASLVQIAAAQLSQGVSGRPNLVWDVTKRRLVLGRFGWKANQPTLRQQVAAAFIGDIGVTSVMFPNENCTSVQQACKRMPPGNTPELFPEMFDALLAFMRGTGVPARRDTDDPQVQHGEQLFQAAGCAACHVPELRTGDYPPMPALQGQLIRPYSDLLLHDMGAELADGRPDFGASGSEWRTPPLWGVGLTEAVSGRMSLLHDGRARDFAEAILWHGGEASAAREVFRSMSREQRAALIKFLYSL
jgi:CxxC motif-containing protein (DUF1111 family)